MKKVLFSIITVFSLISCDQLNNEELFEYADQEVLYENKVSMYSLSTSEELEISPPRTHESLLPPPPSIQEVDDPNKEDFRLKIIKTAELSIEVDSLEKAKSKLDVLLKEANGYYVFEKYNHFSNSEKYDLKIKVPYQNFNKLLAESKISLGRVIKKNQQAKDVSREYYDIDLRLKTKKTFLDRYRSLLQEATKVEEMIKIQEKIRVLEEEIESAIGQLRYYDHNVKYSTIHLALHEIYPTPIPEYTIAKSIWLAFKQGQKSLGSFLLWALSMWPIAFVVSLIWIIRRKVKTYLFRSYGSKSKIEAQQ